MPTWAVIPTVVASIIVALVTLVNLFRSFKFATKDDIERLERHIENINQRIDRHLEGHS